MKPAEARGVRRSNSDMAGIGAPGAGSQVRVDDPNVDTILLPGSGQFGRASQPIIPH